MSALEITVWFGSGFALGIAAMAGWVSWRLRAWEQWCALCGAMADHDAMGHR